jgi:hypothetical protein
MSHIAKSKVLEEIIVELRRKGLMIPTNVMSDLKAFRTLMIVEKVDPQGHGATEPRIDAYMSTVEAYAISEAEKLFPPEKVRDWLAALEKASCETCIPPTKHPKEEIRMIPGVPRDKKGVRVTPIKTLPIEKLEEMATENNLTSRRDKDGHLIVYGDDKDVKEFVKKMTKQQNGTS